MHTATDGFRLTAELANRVGNAKLPGYIAVEGPIGVGKTTLTRRMAEVFGYQTLLEPAAENPFLDGFYRGEQQALATQLFFLLHRTRQVHNINPNDLLGTRIVADFLMAKDRIFAGLTLDEHEFTLYEQIYQTLHVEAPQPDLVIYLHAPVPVLLSRIRQRGVSFEQHIEANYLERLIDAYTEFFHFYDSAPLLVVNAAEIDFANNRQHFEPLVQQVLSMDGMRQFFNPHPTLLEQGLT